jgi:hypothetical protein
MIRNLLPVAPKLAIAEMGYDAYQQYGGALTQPSNWRSRETVALAPVWAMDNGAFSGFHADLFRRYMDVLYELPRCLFVVVPDVVRDHAKTLEWWHTWHAEIRERGYPRAFVLQNGVTLESVPFDECEAVFIGGSTEFKFTPLVREIVAEAKRKGKWVHNGRVNTQRRIRYSLAIGCDSFDGTTYAIEPAQISKHLIAQQNKQGLLL